MSIAQAIPAAGAGCSAPSIREIPRGIKKKQKTTQKKTKKKKKKKKRKKGEERGRKKKKRKEIMNPPADEKYLHVIGIGLQTICSTAQLPYADAVQSSARSLRWFRSADDLLRQQQGRGA